MLLARPYLTAVLPVLLCAGAAKLGDAEAVTKHLDEGKHVDEVVSRHTVKLQPKQESHRLDGSPVKLVTVSFMHALCLLSLVQNERGISALGVAVGFNRIEVVKVHGVTLGGECEPLFMRFVSQEEIQLQTK